MTTSQPIPDSLLRFGAICVDDQFFFLVSQLIQSSLSSDQVGVVREVGGGGHRTGRTGEWPGSPPPRQVSPRDPSHRVLLGGRGMQRCAECCEVIGNKKGRCLCL